MQACSEIHEEVLATIERDSNASISDVKVVMNSSLVESPQPALSMALPALEETLKCCSFSCLSNLPDDDEEYSPTSSSSRTFLLYGKIVIDSDFIFDESITEIAI